MAEWLGNGLQNRVQQFDSAWYLQKQPTPSRHSPEGVFFYKSTLFVSVSDCLETENETR